MLEFVDMEGPDGKMMRAFHPRGTKPGSMALMEVCQFTPHIESVLAYLDECRVPLAMARYDGEALAYKGRMEIWAPLQAVIQACGMKIPSTDHGRSLERVVKQTMLCAGRIRVCVHLVDFLLVLGRFCSVLLVQEAHVGFVEWFTAVHPEFESEFEGALAEEAKEREHWLKEKR